MGDIVWIFKHPKGLSFVIKCFEKERLNVVEPQRFRLLLTMIQSLLKNHKISSEMVLLLAKSVMELDIINGMEILKIVSEHTTKHNQEIKKIIKNLSTNCNGKTQILVTKMMKRGYWIHWLSVNKNSGLAPPGLTKRVNGNMNKNGEQSLRLNGNLSKKQRSDRDDKNQRRGYKAKNCNITKNANYIFPPGLPHPQNVKY